MNLKSKLKLEVGDTVNWIDPDADIGSGVYRIIEVVTESGRVESEDTVVVLSDNEGSCNEVFLYEVA